MSIKLSTLRQFLGELCDTILENGKEPGDFELVLRGRNGADYEVEIGLKKAITLDILSLPPMEAMNKPDFDLVLDNIRVRIEHVKTEEQAFPRAKAFHEAYHRPVNFHSSQLWNMLCYARTFDNDKEAYINVLSQYFPSVYTRLFKPVEKAEDLP